MVEHSAVNRRVGGSSPPPRAILIPLSLAGFFFVRADIKSSIRSLHTYCFRLLIFGQLFYCSLMFDDWIFKRFIFNFA